MAKTRFASLLVLFLVCACSSINVTKDTYRKDAVRALSSTGIVLRISEKGILSQESCVSGILSWLESTRLNKKVIVIPSSPSGVSRWMGRDDRLYQLSTEGEYQRYKSLGIARIYLRNQGAELLKIMEDNGLDSLVIFETDGFFSQEMQFIDLNSVLMLVNRKLDIVYMDHHSENSDIAETDDAAFRRILIDRQSARLIHTLEYLEFLDSDL